jgi:hypothetical protein
MYVPSMFLNLSFSDNSSLTLPFSSSSTGHQIVCTLGSSGASRRTVQ